MLGKQYSGVILEDKWGNTYICSKSLLAYVDFGQDYLWKVQDRIYGVYFLHDLEPYWDLRRIWSEMYQHARPWEHNLAKYTDFQLRDALIEMFAEHKMWVWQLTEGPWGKPPPDSGIGDGGLAPAPSNAASAAPVIKASKPGGGVSDTPAQQSKIASHNTTSATPISMAENIVSNPTARQALYKKHGIEVGPYKELQKITKQGYQREHFIPHSCFMDRSILKDEKRADAPIGKAFGSYNEGDAITYFVFDDQSKGTEHRYLTDIEKNFAKSLHDAGKYASVNEWLDHMECETARSLSMDTIERAPGVYEARVPEEESKLVAKAIRVDTENYLDQAGVDKNAPMSNLVGGGDVPCTDQYKDKDEFRLI